MLEFTSLTYKNYARARVCYRKCPYGLSDYSVGMKLMWRQYFKSEAAYAAGCLIIKNDFAGMVRFDYPVPENDDADISAALDEIEKYCMDSYIPLVYYAVPQEKLGQLAQRYRFCRTDSCALFDEYVYCAENLSDFSGKHYSGQRNHINKFHKLYPEAEFRVLTKADKSRINEFFDGFAYGSAKNGRDADTELHRSRAAMTRDFSWGCAGCIELDGKIIACSLGEICGDTMIIHIEKALRDYEGAYPAMVEAFAKRFCGGVRYINREEDGGDSGLRRSKTQYRPKLMLGKYDVYVETELRKWDKIPHIRSERLTMNAITEADEKEYNALCLDDELNKYWGYDYRDERENPDEKYFVGVAEADFRTKTAANFAIRLGKNFIGEVVLYDFDYHGGAQIGVRILPKYRGHGYGKEAVGAVAEKALYSLGLSVVWARCYKENIKSSRMLSACMEKTGEDENFRYFEKRI